MRSGDRIFKIHRHPRFTPLTEGLLFSDNSAAKLGDKLWHTNVSNPCRRNAANYSSNAAGRDNRCDVAGLTRGEIRLWNIRRVDCKREGSIRPEPRGGHCQRSNALTLCRPLPVYPNEQTFSESVACLKCVGSRRSHSITWSARARNAGDKVNPITLAVLRLTARSNIVGCSTGRSAGFAPFKILSTRSAARRYLSGKRSP